MGFILSELPLNQASRQQHIIGKCRTTVEFEAQIGLYFIQLNLWSYECRHILTADTRSMAANNDKSSGVGTTPSSLSPK